MPTESALLSDDDLVEIGARTAYEERPYADEAPLWDDLPEIGATYSPPSNPQDDYRAMVRAILDRIRAPLVARGIELAAEHLDYIEPSTGSAWDYAGRLRALARQRAEQGDGK